MRFIVLGAGAVGGVTGGRLHQAGYDVILIARGDHLTQIQTDGLVIETPDEDVTVDVPAVGSPSEVEWRDGDVVLLAVKSHQTDRALDDLVAAFDASDCSVPVVCLQNGVESERRVLRRMPDVYGVNVMLASDHLQPGFVAAYSTPVTGSLNIGCYPHGVDSTAHTIAAAFRNATLLSEPSERIMTQKYAKLLLNLGNASQALCGNDAFSSSVTRRARQEAEHVLEMAGIEVAPPGFDSAQRELFDLRPIKDKPRGGGSTWQSLARGVGSVETDNLNGEIVLLGRLHDVPTPVNEALQRLMTRAVRERWRPGAMTEAELEAAVDRLTAANVPIAGESTASAS